MSIFSFKPINKAICIFVAVKLFCLCNQHWVILLTFLHSPYWKMESIVCFFFFFLKRYISHFTTHTCSVKVAIVEYCRIQSDLVSLGR
jgi:hypothetical protein